MRARVLPRGIASVRRNAVVLFVLAVMAVMTTTVGVGVDGHPENGINHV